MLIRYYDYRTHEVGFYSGPWDLWHHDEAVEIAFQEERCWFEYHSWKSLNEMLEEHLGG